MIHRAIEHSNGFVMVEALVAIAILSTVATVAYAAGLAITARGEADLDQLALMSTLSVAARAGATFGQVLQDMLPAIDGPYRLSLRPAQAVWNKSVDLERGIAVMHVERASITRQFADAPIYVGE